MALSKGDWIRAALFAIADRGTAGVVVEPPAASLGTTKGSFYWHFRSRELAGAPEADPPDTTSVSR
jgi:AcrR family transcriptional regulator